MSELTNKAAYIKGLIDGMKLDPEKNETKVFSAIVEFLENAADEIELLDQEQGFLADEIDDIEDVVDSIADELVGEEDDEDTFCVKCDNCDGEVYFTEDDLDDIVNGEFTCPYCGEKIELDLSAMEDDGCGCDCGCDHDHE